jgi:hypothetical protein
MLVSRVLLPVHIYLCVLTCAYLMGCQIPMPHVRATKNIMRVHGDGAEVELGHQVLNTRHQDKQYDLIK